ncbi:N-acetylmuramoyl-L-alanine amidase [Gammaproteobacteria bacterium]|nr:N-acetylmuramoyl-L-alanine amidase [Gammaproteobacteria bacterium]CAG0941848.1 N-acetylmuramoyl-L-alanine amidase [Gammaproteobacteria bacterium]
MRKAWYLSTVVFAAALAASTAFAGQASVERLALSSAGTSTTLVLEMTDSSEYRLFTLQDPYRVVVDLLSARLMRQALPLPAGTGSVRQLRAANRPDGSLRIVLDMAAPAIPEPLLRTAGGAGGTRLQIGLAEATPPAKPVVTEVATAREAAPPPATAQAPVAMVADPPAVQPETAAPAALAAPESAAGTSSPRTGRDIIIAIDAGHGGKDPGAHGPRGVLEKDITLRLARRLAEVVNAEPGMRAVLTRDQDEFIPLRGRMERARKASADLFISVHADAVRDRDVQGSSVYVLNEKGATDEAARRLAARENAADLIGGVSLRTRDPTLASVLLDLSQNASLSSSIEVADEILQQMARVGTVRKPQVMQAPFMVLKSPDVPSVLIETAYISNPEEERRLDNNEYRGRLATAIFAGVRDYFYRNPPRGTLVAELSRQRLAESVQHVIRPGETLSGLAARYNVSVRRIRDANQLHTDRVAPGQVLRIPAAQET